MSYALEAKLFYGFVNPGDEDDGEDNWGDLDRYNPEDTCRLEIFGSDGFIRYALIVKESLYTIEWNAALPLPSNALNVKPYWDSYLISHAEAVGIELEGLEPSWHLVALYF